MDHPGNSVSRFSEMGLKIVKRCFLGLKMDGKKGGLIKEFIDCI
jgi:hypothetical protein